jgi:hypothetical protein
MPWFRIDDKAHSHPKLMKAGNAALGLWLRCGSYAAQHLTEGVVPGVVAQLYGTAPQAKKLVAAGLWHEQGHACPRCPQPAAGDYVMHDYLEDGRNTSRARYEAGKKAARDRQAKHREEAAGEAKGGKSAPKTDRFEDDSPRKKSESDPENLESSEETAGHSDSSRRDATVTGIQAKPATSSTSYRGTAGSQDQLAKDGPAHIGDRPRIPENSRPLVDALTAAGLIVGWDLVPSEWFLIEALIQRCGIPALVTSARGSWQGARSQPRSGRYFLPAWREVPDAVPLARQAPSTDGGGTADVVPLASRQQQQTDDLFGRAMQRAQNRMETP